MGRPDGLDLIPQRSGVGTVPSCAEGGLPRVAKGVRGRWKARYGWQAQEMVRKEVCKGAQRCAKGCTIVCKRCADSMGGCTDGAEGCTHSAERCTDGAERCTDGAEGCAHVRK